MALKDIGYERSGFIFLQNLDDLFENPDKPDVDLIRSNENMSTLTIQAAQHLVFFAESHPVLYDQNTDRPQN